MAPPLQRIHPRLATAALSFVRKPAAPLGVWTQTPAMFSGSASRYAGPDAGTTQQQLQPLFAAIPNGVTHQCLVVQLLTDPLREQTISAGTWRVSFAAQLANAGAAFTWGGMAALHVVNGLTGARRGTIFNTSAIGSTGRTTTAVRTCLATISGAEVKVRAGDYLSLELGLAVANAAGALAPQASVLADGTTHISADNVAIASARSVLEAPAALPVSLPTTGEQERPSVTHAQAVQLLKEHFPPNSDVLYAWNEADAVIKHFFDWLGDCIKIYGYDQVDRIFREVNPLTCVELLPAWEAHLGLAQGRIAQRGITVTQRRNLVLSHLRELGPLTVFSLASIFARLADYAPGTRPDVIELSKDDHHGAIRESDVVPTADGTIPEGTAFDGTNLIRSTRVLPEGMEVSEAGAYLVITLDQAQSSNLHFQLLGPDFTTATWGGDAYPLPDLDDVLHLRAVAHAGKSIQGKWRLYAYRDVGSPAVVLESWELIVFGRGHGGSAHVTWSVHLDSSHQNVDRRDVESTLDRITQSYARGFCVYALTGVPGTALHRPGRFVPGG